MKSKKEVRLLPARELRAAKNADGKSTLSGYAAVFNSLSDDLGGWREKIAPDAFTRTLKDQPDVYCLYAHGSQVLGRTKAGTLTLNIDAHGLHFDNTLPDTMAARDLTTSIERGDVDGCSFGFFVRDDDWEEDGTGMVVRTLMDVELGEISVTPMPAYPATSVSLRSAPQEIRNKINLQRSAAKVNRDATDTSQDQDACLCACSECMDGDCENCSNTMCADPNCRCMMSRSKRSYTGNTQKVDGVDLTKDCFAYTPDDVPSHWKFPIHFPGDEEKTKCLVGSTPIPLLDGRTLPISEVQEGQWVYSFDVERRTVAPGRVLASALSGVKVPIVRVHLDNGEVVECTPNHPFLMLGCQYKMAGDLQPGESVMPLYIKEAVMWLSKDGRNKKHYEQVFQPWYGAWEFTHRLVHREHNNVPLLPGHHIDHLDQNHRDNSPTNLQQLSRAAHMRKHAADCDWWGGVNADRRKAASLARWDRPGAAIRQSLVVKAENERRKKLGIRYAVKTIDNLPDLYERYARGESLKRLGAEIGVSGHTITRRFIEAGFQMRDIPCHVRTIENIKALHAEYLGGATLRSLADKAGVSNGTLLYKWKALELPRKKNANAEESIGDLLAMNHKVILVEDGGLADVYDLEVEKYSNFAVGQGVFVHNTHIRNALARFDQADIPEDAKKEVHAKIVAAAKAHGIEVSDEADRSVKPPVVDGPGSTELRAPACQCDCSECRGGSCETCSKADCVDPECRCMTRTIKNRMQMRIRLAMARKK